MGLIKGITVKLTSYVVVGENRLGEKITEPVTTMVDNVLVSPITYTDRVDELNLSGHRLEYELAIPKGDTNQWVNSDVEFFGKKFHIHSEEAEGIEENIPLSWNKKVRCERLD